MNTVMNLQVPEREFFDWLTVFSFSERIVTKLTSDKYPEGDWFMSHHWP
jgi:hypothetical protein